MNCNARPPPPASFICITPFSASTRIFLWDLAEAEITGVYQAVSNAGTNLLPEAAGLRGCPSQIKIVRQSTLTVPWAMQAQGKPTIGPLTDEVIEQLFKLRLDELREEQARFAEERAAVAERAEEAEQADYTDMIRKVQQAARMSSAAKAEACK